MIFEIIVGVCLIIIFIFWRHYKIRKEFAPGPIGFPFLGILPSRFFRLLFHNFLPKTPERMFFLEMKEKYGDVWSFELGSQRVLVLGSIGAVNEVFVDKGKFITERPKLENFKVISNNCGIIFTSGKIWDNNRQLAVKALKDLGMGKRSLKDEVCDESHELIDYIGMNLPTTFTNPSLFVKPTSNVITKLVFNDRNNYEDPELTKYLANVKHVFSSIASQNIIDFFPNFYKSKIMKMAFPFLDKFLKCNTECLNFVDNKCRARIKVESEFSKPNCVFDYFWRYLYQDYPNVSYDEKFLNISHSMYDLYNGGTDTTTNTLGFSCLILGQHQDLQDELRKEVHLLADDYKLIYMDMRKDCPKLLSFLDEIQRFFYLVPIAYHGASERFEFRGYVIETVDTVIADLTTIARDPKYFKNPDNFDPNRFLDSTRSKYIPSKNFIPFGTGRRNCLGESIAVMEMFLFLSKIIHKFTISLTEETKSNIDDILEGKVGIVHAPLEHEIIFKINTFS